MTAHQGEAAITAIERERARIDEIDRQILALVSVRRQASEAVQQARMRAGGNRTETRREMEIIRRYSNPLGRPGVAIAQALLEICRGPVTVDSGPPQQA